MIRILKYFLWLSLLFVLLVSSPIRNGVSNIFEEKPISEKTIEELRKHKMTISYFADRYAIPEEVILASIGSEINRRIYINMITDCFQNYFFSSKLCTNRFLELLINYSELKIMQHDIGLGNISFNTAWSIFKKYDEELPNIQTKRDMADYLLTYEGNIHIASLVIKEGMSLLEGYCHKMNILDKHAVFYSYYKQGNSFYDRYKQNSQLNRAPIPGGGQDILQTIKEKYHK